CGGSRTGCAGATSCATSRSTTVSAAWGSARRASSSRSRPRTAPTRSRRARTRSTSSRNRCRCGRKRTTKAARNGSGEDHRTVSDDSYERGYDPIHPRGTDWRGRIRKLLGPLLAAIVALAKFSFVLVKFGSIFIAVAAYALIWGWRFAVGLVLLILLHETGHYIGAKREGLEPKLPMFVPFLGAYVQYTRGNPWQTARVAFAGPILGGVASLVCYLVSVQQGSDLLSALAYF